MKDDTNGELRPKTEAEIKTESKGWMHGLTSAFKKIRTHGILNLIEITSLTRFIDEYTTVSIHENTVGKEVARIAQEVNKHHHTKTCRKHDTTCRFSYPRFPAPHTIIVKPCMAESPEEKEKMLVSYRKILRKVQDVLEDEDAIKKIMGNFDKQTESKEEYNANREARIRELCNTAGVTYNQYLNALGASKSGYSVVQKKRSG